MSDYTKYPDEGIIAFKEYVNQVLEPVESLARLLRDAQFDVKEEQEDAVELKGSFSDIAQVVGALNSLARYRLLECAQKLDRITGGVIVGVPDVCKRNVPVVDYRVANMHLFHTLFPKEK